MNVSKLSDYQLTSILRGLFKLPTACRSVYDDHTADALSMYSTAPCNWRQIRYILERCSVRSAAWSKRPMESELILRLGETPHEMCVVADSKLKGAESLFFAGWFADRWTPKLEPWQRKAQRVVWFELPEDRGLIFITPVSDFRLKALHG